jgi:hypothetical protein
LFFNPEKLLRIGFDLAIHNLMRPWTLEETSPKFHAGGQLLRAMVLKMVDSTLQTFRTLTVEL